MWFDVKDYSSVCHFLIVWDLWFWNKLYCVWSNNYVDHTLRNYAYFIGEGFLPDHFLTPPDKMYTLLCKSSISMDDSIHE